MSAIRLCLILFTVQISCQISSDNKDVSAAVESFWGEAGSIAFVKAHNQMLTNYPDYVFLDNKEKKVLRPVFGSLVDSVKIHWNAQPLNEWASDHYGIQMIGEEAIAQCYGYHIFIKGQREKYQVTQLMDLYLHEMTHSLQFKDLNEDLKRFGDEYFRAYYKAGEVYELNLYEIEADKRAQLWVDRLTTDFNALN